ncbi:AraC family transcriptional regulator [Paenarthrobacter sp. UW852]|uniref:AraC family transcriptional regulator n=1 Tax=Micrococcaceae TaxID=1268 RepID=UPI00214925DF|nr:MULTISPECIES: AraC family transcriptional regulator [Micrococcaceae]MCR1161518.1 AraC family transcriptional regulator [Paenarthrobacter sp. UW852]
MIQALNQLVDYIEGHLSEEIDIDVVAVSLGMTEYHLRRMFSALAGLPLSEYVRRRRMTVAATDVLGEDGLLAISVRYGYGSTEAFNRAFRSVHGVGPGHIRRNGGPLHTQPQLRFHLTVEGNTTMKTRIVDRPAFRLAGHSVRVPLIHHGPNPHIQAHIASLPVEEHARLKDLSGTDPKGLLQVSADVDPDYKEGSDLTYLHGVAVTETATVPEELDVIKVPAGTWAVFHAEGAYPEVLQSTWAATTTDWFPSNPWRLRPGPSMVAILDRTADFSEATCELWLPIERS